jgi:hypothetical protein
MAGLAVPAVIGDCSGFPDWWQLEQEHLYKYRLG